MKSWYTSKLFWAGFSEAASGLALLFTDMPEGTSIGFIVSGLATIILRFATNTGLTK